MSIILIEHAGTWLLLPRALLVVPAISPMAQHASHEEHGRSLLPRALLVVPAISHYLGTAEGSQGGHPCRLLLVRAGNSTVTSQSWWRSETAASGTTGVTA